MTALASMTGFARTTGRFGSWDWAWEARSVNGKGLDVRLRLPPGCDALDPPARGAIARWVTRGSLSVSLALTHAAPEPGYRLNEALLAQLLEICARHGAAGIAPPRLDGLLGLRGVLEPVTDGGPADPAEDLAARDRALIAGLDDALAALVAARREEGARLAVLVGGHLDRLDALVAAARRCESLRPEAVRARLTRQIADILEGLSGLSLPGAASGGDPAFRERLAQEMALLAVKADVREELDRLTAHVEAARALLTGGAVTRAGAVAPEGRGRRLEFLAQEFNREANTLCAKSQDVTLTRIGLDMKAVIDQFREQSLNLE